MWGPKGPLIGPKVHFFTPLKILARGLVIFMMSIKLLFDLWPRIQFTIFEEEPCHIEEEPCQIEEAPCKWRPSEEESIHFEKVFLIEYRCDITVCLVHGPWILCNSPN